MEGTSTVNYNDLLKKELLINDQKKIIESLYRQDRIIQKAIISAYISLRHNLVVLNYTKDFIEILDSAFSKSLTEADLKINYEGSKGLSSWGNGNTEINLIDR